MSPQCFLIWSNSVLHEFHISEAYRHDCLIRRPSICVYLKMIVLHVWQEDHRRDTVSSPVYQIRGYVVEVGPAIGDIN